MSMNELNELKDKMAELEKRDGSSARNFLILGAIVALVAICVLFGVGAAEIALAAIVVLYIAVRIIDLVTRGAMAGFTAMRKSHQIREYEKWKNSQKKD